MSNNPSSWYSDFLGVGYRYHDIYMNVLLLFKDMPLALKKWNDTVDKWSDDKIRLRFIEKNEAYWFILYSEGISMLMKNNSGFVKKMNLSDNYVRFKSSFEKKVIIRFASYKDKIRKKENDAGYELKLLKKSKNLYDVQFHKYEDLEGETIESNCIKQSLKND